MKQVVRNQTLDNRYKNEFQNSLNVINSLEIKIKTQFTQLNPLLGTRQKRGLINGLGSIIKSLTGNLDQSDAEKYDEIISNLNKNQNDLKSQIKNHVTILENVVNEFGKNTETLSHNQLALEAKIYEIEQIIKNYDLTRIDTHNYFLIHITFTQLASIYQMIYNQLDKIEVAISLAKLNTFHNSIVEPADLLNELNQISSKLSIGKLPVKPEIGNILLIEKIMEIKSYSKRNKIMFIIEIPVVEQETYNYYHLFPLPVWRNNKFNFIIPQSKFLIINGKNYMLLNSQCKELYKNQFICQEDHLMEIQEQANPCEIELIKFTKNLTNCFPMQAEFHHLKVQHLEKNLWLIITPESEVIIQNCNSNIENQLIKGTFILEAQPNCFVKIKNIQIKTSTISSSKFKNLELPKIKSDFKTSENPKLLNLDKVNLKEINHLKTVIKSEKLLNNDHNHILRNKFNIWTIFNFVCLLIIVSVCFYVKLFKKRFSQEPVQEGPMTPGLL